ncbi:hypothetical protein Tco_0066333 [Tanacetum coccineum]
MKPTRKDTQVPQPSDPIENVADEAVHKELGDSLVRATTTASSLEAEQDSGNITKTRSKATPNESSFLGTTSGGGPRGNTLQSDEDRLKLNELMELCTNLQNRVFDLEKTKTTQANEIASLKRRVKKEEVFVAGQNENVVEEIVDAAQVSTVATTPGESTTTKSTPTISSQQSQDKQERLTREKAEKEKEANIALIEEWDDIQAKIDFDYQLAERFLKKQKVDDDKETTELKQCMEIIPDEEEVTIDAIPLAVKSPRIVD